MNQIYRLCWNRTLRAWVPASELAKSNTRGVVRRRVAVRLPLMLSLLAAQCMTGLAWAGTMPTGGQIVAGSGQIQHVGDVTIIRQNSQMLSMNWQSFDIAAGQTVNFLQPGTSSIAINRILGNTASAIYGHLNANGQVWLINPNGVLFGQNAQVNVGGIVASTLDLDDSTLGTDNIRFAGNGRGRVVNQGHITAAQGGYVALLGNQVSNQGVIRAQLGTVALGGGSAMTLTFSDSHLMHLMVDASTIRSLVENRQLIVANGGDVLMTAGARASLVESVVNNTGTVQARSVDEHNGTITLLGGMQTGTVQVGGTLDASAPDGGDGGTIETSAAHFQLASDARITAAATGGKGGTWLVDPVDLTIDGAAATTISNTLNGGTSVTEQTTATGASGPGTQTTGSGDINVNAAINWSSAATLTLDAYRNINVNAAITGLGGGGAVMNAGGGTFTVGNTGRLSASGGTTINAGAFVNNASASALGAKWMLYSADPAANTLGGLAANYIQYNATQGSPLSGSGNGLIYSVAPTLQITGLTGTVSKVYDNTTGADDFTGANFKTTGLLNGDTIASAGGGSYGSTNVGTGIAVTAPGAIANYVIVNNGISVYGYTLSGGPISDAVGTITPKQLTAAIVGNPAKVYNGTTTATLASSNYKIDGFASGQGATVSQPSSVAYAGSDAGAVAVNATFSKTNFVANNGTSLSNYILPVDATGMGTINKAPLLISGLLANNKTYNGTMSASLNTSGAGLYGVIQPDSGLVTLDLSGMLGSFAQSNVGNGIAVSVSGYALGGSKANNYELSVPSGLFADITPRALTIDQVTAANKEYDGTTDATLDTSLASLQNSIAGDDVTLNSGGVTGTFSQSDAGNNLAVSSTGFSLTGAAAGNYVLSQPTLQANITPKTLTISMIGTPEKTYDGTNAVLLGSGNFNISGFVGTQSAQVAQSSAMYASPNAGSSIGVTATLQPSDFTVGAGTSMSNYTFAPSVVGVGLGKIDPLQLTGTIVGNPTKVYDGTTTASLGASNLTLQGMLPGQVINVDFSGTVAGNYTSSDAGAWSVNAGYIDASHFTATGGTLLSNYLLPALYLGSGLITPAPLSGEVITASINGTTRASKIYDGKTDITLGADNFTLSGFVGGDSATVDPGASIDGHFGQSDVGTDIALSAMLVKSDLVAGSGTNLANYQIAAPSYGLGDITPKLLNVSISGNPTKIYNGSTDAALATSNFNILGWAAGEGGSINPTATASYDSASAGSRTITAVLTPGNYIANAGTKLSNYTLVYSATGHGTIDQAPLYITGVYATNKTYDTTAGDALNLAKAGLAGLVDSDTGKVTLGMSGATAVFAQKNVGTGLVVTASGFTIGGDQAANYILQPVTGLYADIGKATLTLAGVTANDKDYDGNNIATLTSGGATLNNVFAADAGTVGFDAAGAGGVFSTVNAGSDLQVTASGYTLTGVGASNYQLAQPAGLKATINRKALTAVIIGTPTKVYDGTDSATLTASDYTLQGFVGSDSATIPQSATGHYATQNAGTGLGVESTLMTSDFLAAAGTNLANYILPTTGSGSGGVIEKVVINLTGTRVYDSTRNVDASVFGVLQGVNNETLGLTGGGTLSSKNVGKQGSFANLGSLVLANGGNGGLASNYTLAGGVDWVTVTPATLSASFSAFDKIYDGTTVATLNGAATLTGLLGSDAVTLDDPTGARFSDKNVGTGKTVTGAMSISGTDASNYAFTQGTATASISQLHITVGATAQNRQYDATTAATVALKSADVISGDKIDFKAQSNGANFASKDVGNGIVVTATGITSSGADAANYFLDNTTATSAADITPRVLNLSGTRVYDGTTVAGAGTFNGGVIAGVSTETLTLGGNYALSRKNVDTYSWKGAIGDGLTLGDGSNGGLASNYTLIGGSDSYKITPRALTATFTADGKVYDGNTTAMVQGATLESNDGTSGLILDDDVALTNATAGKFDNKNVGTGKTVTGAMSITGGDAGNYTFTNGTSTADITKLDLTVTATGSDKTYDGKTTAAVTLGGGLVGDSLTYSKTSANYVSKDAGLRDIDVEGISIGGADAGNYNLLNTAALTSGTINQVVLNLGGTRVYDGTVDAAASLFGTNGVLECQWRNG